MIGRLLDHLHDCWHDRWPDRFADLERGDAKGVTVENMGFKADSSGVWLNDLTALQETAP